MNKRRYYGGTGDPYSRKGRGSGTGRFKLFLLIGLGMALFQGVKYLSMSQVNPVTGEEQRISWSVEEEVAIGIQSAPQMAQQHGGLYPDEEAQRFIDVVGQKLIDNSFVNEAPYPFEFHLLADQQTVNAFALPGGQVFITAALFSRFTTEDQLAGVLGHEIGHVIYRHGAVRVARSSFIQGLVQSAMLLFGGDPSMAEIANVVGQYTSMKYGRDQELESDDFGVRVMMEAGYNPEQLVDVMKILKEASGGRDVPEFQSSHPNPENRIDKIYESIEKYKTQL
ncbi:MAG TPA: M48 family metalloprotease [Saprospiraceae bacterium]|nr:M48 family metalloprotease [Saprospiraceae bacterium]